MVKDWRVGNPRHKRTVLPTSRSWVLLVARGDEAMLRSVERLQQASQPLYNNLFLPFSNQPDGTALHSYSLPLCNCIMEANEPQSQS